jgi:hypothetical protein
MRVPTNATNLVPDNSNGRLQSVHMNSGADKSCLSGLETLKELGRSQWNKVEHLRHQWSSRSPSGPRTRRSSFNLLQHSGPSISFVVEYHARPVSPSPTTHGRIIFEIRICGGCKIFEIVIRISFRFCKCPMTEGNSEIGLSLRPSAYTHSAQGNISAVAVLGVP